jgi:hypothetical protein
LTKKYVPINGWTITSGGKQYSPTPANQPVFIKGLSDETAERLLRERKIQVFELPMAEPSDDDPLNVTDKVNISRMTRNQLISHAKTLGLDVTGAANVADMRKMIEEARAN